MKKRYMLSAGFTAFMVTLAMWLIAPALVAQSPTPSGCQTSSVTYATACDSFVWNGKTFFESTIEPCIGGIKALDGSNKYYRYATVYDWDCCLFGGQPVAEGGFSWLVDGHYTIQYDCNGNGVVVEATGNYAGLLGTARNDNYGYSSNPTWKSLVTNAGCCNGDGSKIFVRLTGLVMDGFTMHFKNVAGCDSAATLMLTINKRVKMTGISAGQNPLCTNRTTDLTALNVSGTNAVVNWYTGSGGTGTLLGTGIVLPSVSKGLYYARVTGTCGVPVQRSIRVLGDAVKPTITCPTDTIITTSKCSTLVTTRAPVYGDNCSVKSLTWKVQGATTQASLAYGIRLMGSKMLNAGLNTVTYTVKDSANLAATCSYNITVNSTATCFSNFAGAEKETPVDLQQARLVTNPARGAFALQLGSARQGMAVVSVYHASGALAGRWNVPMGRTTRIGENLQPGVYVLEVVQGDYRQMIKAIKE